MGRYSVPHERLVSPSFRKEYMARFRKKPVVIEATQWFAKGDHQSVLECYFDTDGRIRWAPGDPQEINVYGCVRRAAIKTLEGWHEVTPGDWIITGIKGEHYPCKPDIFAATYETAEYDGDGTD